MKQELKVYNTLKKEKEIFKPINPEKVGMYVCGPTVYSDVHLGNCRTFVSFDVIYRYLLHIGYNVRYVRNITDVGHLRNDGSNRVEDQAKLEALEPMEVVQKYTLGFHEIMGTLNALPPSIEPTASGHIIEQIEMVQAILDNGFAYEKNGSVYFDTLKFAEAKGVYGQLSGRVLDDLIAESREDLHKQDEKNNPADFAIWVKATPDHIMRWNSPWSEGYPGWHLECSAMSTKYLGKTFDIHGGGNDLKFPHHENEVAQNVGACDCQPANYWLHTNMLLMNGKKMSKTDGNTITPMELFTGIIQEGDNKGKSSKHVTKGYSPMVIRFFMLQSHYRSTMDLSDEALQAAEKGYKRLMEAYKTLQGLSGGGSAGQLDEEINELIKLVNQEMADDFNTPKALARLFELVTKINGLRDGHLKISEVSPATLELLKQTFHAFIYDVFGLKDELEASGANNGILDGLMELIIQIRQDARANKDWGTSDKIRDTLAALEIQLKDSKEGTSWTVNS